jgi:hypothetical protein
VRRVIRREEGTPKRFRRGNAEAQPDPALLRRAASLTDLRERRAAYEAAQQSHPAGSLRGSRVVAVLTVACAAVVTFVLTVLAAVVGNAWVAATVAALVTAAVTALARRGAVTAIIDSGGRARRLTRDVREPLDD